MLIDTYRVHQNRFHAIAALCERAGSPCVRLFDGDELIDTYPAGAEPSEPILVAWSQAGLAIHICGLSGDFWQSTAEMMIELFSSFLNSESELESLTAALVETQDRLVALYDLTKAARRTLEIPTLLELLPGEICQLLAASGAFAILSQPDQASVIRQYTQNPLSDEQINIMTTLYHQAAHQHTFRDPDSLPVGLRNAMMVSIPVRDGLLATLGVYNKTGDFTSPDIKLAIALAEQTGAQLENALLAQESLVRTRIETEMRLAHTVQTALLPQALPVIPGLDLYATSRPALEVGGDFFDLVLLPSHPLIFALGDVTGKGMSAALLMTMARTVVRSAARNMPFTAPHQLMKRLNDDLLDDFSAVGMFSTVFIGLLDETTLSLSYCNAGQSPILYLPANREPVLLEALDIPIGIFTSYDYNSQALALSPGDIFIAASDGFPETRDTSGEMFGYERLKQAFAATRNLSAQEMAENLFTATNIFSGGQPQDDDDTLIIIKIL